MISRCHQKATISNLVPIDSRDVTLLVGPEEGWTSTEIVVAIEDNYQTSYLYSVVLQRATNTVTALSLVAATRDLLI